MSGQKALLPDVHAELHKRHVQHLYLPWKKKETMVVLGVKNLPANARDVRNVGLIPGWGRSPGGRHGNLLQYSCLENSMDRDVWQAAVRRVVKSWTQLKCLSMEEAS